MAPKPPTLGAPRRSRGAPRYSGRLLVYTTWGAKPSSEHLRAGCVEGAQLQHGHEGEQRGQGHERQIRKRGNRRDHGRDRAAVLFAGFGSVVLALVVADVVIEVSPGPLGGGGTTEATRVKAALAPLAIAGALHVTVPVEAIAGVVHVQPAGFSAEEKWSAASSTTDRLGLAALLGPPFVTTTCRAIPPV